MIFHCRRKSCGAESGTKLGGSRGAAVDRRRGPQDHRLILRMNLSALYRAIAPNELFLISTTANELRGLRRCASRLLCRSYKNVKYRIGAW